MKALVLDNLDYLDLVHELEPGAPLFVYLRDPMCGSEVAIHLRKEGLEYRDTIIVQGVKIAIVLFFRKPLKEPTLVAQVLKTGTGGINIGGCMIEGFVPTPTSVRKYRRFDNKYHDLDSKGNASEMFKPTRPEGRWPGNMILMHRGECHHVEPIVEHGKLIRKTLCVSDCVVQEIERQTTEAGVVGSKTDSGHAEDGAGARFYLQMFSEQELLEWLRKLAGVQSTLAV